MSRVPCFFGLTVLTYLPGWPHVNDRSGKVRKPKTDVKWQTSGIRSSPVNCLPATKLLMRPIRRRHQSTQSRWSDDWFLWAKVFSSISAVDKSQPSLQYTKTYINVDRYIQRVSEKKRPPICSLLLYFE